jgi:hypothetical protein
MIRLIDILFPELTEQRSAKDSSSGEIWMVDPPDSKIAQDHSQARYGAKVGNWIRYFNDQKKARNFAMGRKLRDKSSQGPGLHSTSKSNPRNSKRPLKKRGPDKPERKQTYTIRNDPKKPKS